MKLLESYHTNHLDLPNRMVMAPMTRSRAGEGDAPTDLNTLYYAQRASAGLIISEASQISAQGVGYPWTPGIYTDEQVAGWQKVTRAVREKGGHIFLQLFHCGRISHPVFQGGKSPVAPSAVRPAGEVFTPDGPQPFETPRALETSEIAGIVEQYAKGAKNALKAGFHGVEIHAANGYLPDQFQNDGSNRRTDQYGGSVENRCRFTLEVVEAVSSAVGHERTGIRFSPSGIFNDMSNSDPVAIFEYLVDRLNAYDLAYLHLMEPLMPVDDRPHYLKQVAPHFRDIYRGTLISNGGYNREAGEKALQDDVADLISYGNLFLANPDLPARFAAGAPLNPADEETFYGGTEKGYTDYPFFGG